MTEPDRHAGSRVLWKLVSVAVRVFYRVERVGPPLPDGALLLVANHPNTLLDPSLVQTTAGRPVRFLAKSTLFHGQLLSPLIRGSGAIPVYRKIDPGVDTSRNVEMFAAVQRQSVEVEPHRDDGDRVTGGGAGQRHPCGAAPQPFKMAADMTDALWKQTDDIAACQRPLYRREHLDVA